MNNIKEIIRDKKTSISAIARELGMSKANLSGQLGRIDENNAIKLLRNIAKILNVNVGELLDDNTNTELPKEITIKFNSKSITYTRKEDEQ